MVKRGRAGASEKAGPRGRRHKPRVEKVSARRSVAMVMRGLADAPEEAVAGARLRVRVWAAGSARRKVQRASFVDFGGSSSVS